MTASDDKSRRRFLKASSLLGLVVMFSPRTIAEAFGNSRLRTNKEENSMTDTGAAQGTDKTAIRPFQFNFSDAELMELRKRVNATKWPESSNLRSESFPAPEELNISRDSWGAVAHSKLC